MATTNYRIKHLQTADFLDCANTQMGVMSGNDADLGYRMWGGVDGAGTVTRFCAKNQDAKFNDVLLTDDGGDAKLVHAGDTDTYWQFRADRITITAGNISMLDIIEGATDRIIVNPGGTDVDFEVNTNTISPLMKAVGDGTAMWFQNTATGDTIDADTIVCIDDTTNPQLEFMTDTGSTATILFGCGDTSATAEIVFVEDGDYEQLDFDLRGTEFLTLDSNEGVVVNDDSNDIDFRVESDTYANMLLVDASANGVVVGDDTARAFLHVVDALSGTNDTAPTAGSTFFVESTGNLAMQVMVPATRFAGMYWGSTTNLDQWQMRFDVDNDRFEIMDDGVSAIACTASEIVLNDGSADLDVRWESDASANGFFLEGSTGNMALGTNTPFNGWNQAGNPGLHLYGTVPQIGWQDSAGGDSWLVECTAASQLNFYNDTDTTSYMTFNDGEVAINDGSADIDFRWESDASANGFFLEGNTGNGSFGTNTPFNMWNASPSPGLLMYGTNPGIGFDDSAGGDRWFVYADNSGNLLFLNDTDNSTAGFFDGTNVLRLTASLKLLERAAAPADTAAYGQLWVKNTTPCELWFTDDAGTDTKLA